MNDADSLNRPEALSAFKCTLWRGSTQWPLTITVVLLESTYLSFDYAV